MKTLALLGVSIMVVALIASYARSHGRRTQTLRWKDEQDAWKTQQREHAQDRLAARAERYFPFLKGQLKLASDTSILDSLRQALRDTPGTVVGVGPSALPVVFPRVLRTRHVAIFGRSGTGKSSLMGHILEDDLRHGTGVVVLAAEEEVARDHVLPQIPASRHRDTVYFAPGHQCPITWNPLSVEPGDDPVRWAAEVFVALRAAVGEDAIGPRSDALARNTFAALVPYPGATFLHVRPFLEVSEFREQVLTHVADEEVRAFWNSFEKYDSSATLPLLQRTDRLTAPAIRQTLCQPSSSFSLRKALDESKIVLVDLSGLDPDTTSLLGQLFLARMQLEIMRRERVPENERPFTALYVDECHLWTTSSRSWAQLASRSRRYNCGLVIASQFPTQLREVKREILGNTSCLVSFAVSSESASLLKRELIVPSTKGGGTCELPAQTLITLPVGKAIMRLATGSLAIPVRVRPPLDKKPIEHGRVARGISWKTYGATTMAAVNRSPNVTAIEDTHPSAKSLAAPLGGRGGFLHSLLQQEVRKTSEERGFRAVLEETILGGSGRVDVSITRGAERLAVEVVVTSIPTETAASVGRALAASFSKVVVLSSNPAVLKRAEKHLSLKLDQSSLARVVFLDLDGFRQFLDSMSPADPGAPTTSGYALTVEEEAVTRTSLAARRSVIAGIAGKALLRRRHRP